LSGEHNEQERDNTDHLCMGDGDCGRHRRRNQFHLHDFRRQPTQYGLGICSSRAPWPRWQWRNLVASLSPQPSSVSTNSYRASLSLASWPWDTLPSRTGHLASSASSIYVLTL